MNFVIILTIHYKSKNRANNVFSVFSPFFIKNVWFFVIKNVRINSKIRILTCFSNILQKGCLP